MSQQSITTNQFTKPELGWKIYSIVSFVIVLLFSALVGYTLIIRLLHPELYIYENAFNPKMRTIFTPFLFFIYNLIASILIFIKLRKIFIFGLTVSEKNMILFMTLPSINIALFIIYIYAITALTNII